MYLCLLYEYYATDQESSCCHFSRMHMAAILKLNGRHNIQRSKNQLSQIKLKSISSCSSAHKDFKMYSLPYIRCIVVELWVTTWKGRWPCALLGLRFDLAQNMPSDISNCSHDHRDLNKKRSGAIIIIICLFFIIILNLFKFHISDISNFRYYRCIWCARVKTLASIGALERW